MGKMTFVFEYEDGQEPPVNAGMEFMGGRIVSASFRDALNDDNPISNEIANGELSVHINISAPECVQAFRDAPTFKLYVNQNSRYQV